MSEESNDVDDRLQEAREEAEEIAEAIRRLDASVKALMESGLSRRALLLLIHDACPTRGPKGSKPGKREIEQVLDGMTRLADLYIDGDGDGG